MSARGAIEAVAPSPGPRLRTWILVGFGLAVLVTLGLAGPRNAVGVTAIAAGALPLAAQFRPRFSWAVATVPALLSPFLFLPQVAPAIWVFDPIGVALIVAGVASLIAERRRADWDLGGVQWFVVAMLLVPLLALPVAVVSVVSFLGGYKTIFLEACLLLALPRLVRRAQAVLLLWAFPLSGFFVACQIIWKMRGVGALQSSRLTFRNFYSDLGWGESNYVAAVLVLCALGTVVLLQQQRRLLLRAALGALSLLMVVASIRLYSRGATVALVLGVGVFILGLGRLRSLLVLAATALAGAGFLASPYGRVMLSRFVDPVEYASWAVRVQIWQGMWDRFIAYPWTGIGLNQGRYQADPFGSEAAHNVFMQSLSDQGILGGLLAVLSVYLIFRLVRRLRPANGGRTRELRLASLAMVVAVMANGMIEPTLAGYSYGILFVYFVAWMRLAASPEPLPQTV